MINVNNFFENNLDFWHTNHIFYPDGTQISGNLALFTTGLGILLLKLTDITTTWNIIWISGFIFGGYTTYLLANNFKEEVNQNKTSQAKAYQIESAIKNHIKINLEEDPEYYKSLSERLNEIIRENEEKWEELVQLLFVFRENIESERKERAEDLGLTETEYAFHNILVAEITKKAEGETLNEETHEKVKIVVQSLVKMMDESSKIAWK